MKDPTSAKTIQLGDSWESWVGSLRPLLYLNEDHSWMLFVGLSQGFRAPNLSDLTRLDIANSGELEVPSLGLSPEYFTTYEIGFKAELKAISLEASYYATEISDMIVRSPTGREVQIQGSSFKEVVKQNSGQGWLHGVELAAGWRFIPNWRLRPTISAMHGDMTTYSSTSSSPLLIDEPMTRMMPLTAHLSLRYEPPSSQWWFEIASSAVARQDRLSSSDMRDGQRIPPKGTPGYVTLNLRSGWKINQNFRLLTALENCTDEDYRIHGSGLNEPGRNFILSLEARF